MRTLMPRKRIHVARLQSARLIDPGQNAGGT